MGDDQQVETISIATAHNGQQQQYHNDHQYAEATNELLEILSNEVHKDGGVSAAVTLKDYFRRSKHVNRLLVQSIGSKRMLAFCEHHPHVFQVHRQREPHLIKLLSTQFCTSSSSISIETDAESSNKQLIERVIIVLRKWKAKLSRRHHNAGIGNGGSDTDGTSSAGDTVSGDTSGETLECKLHWLIRQCKTSIHAWLRASNFYIDHTSSDVNNYKPVGSPEWVRWILPHFKSFLENHEDFIIIGTNMVSLSSRTIPDQNYAQQLATILHNCIEKDGGTQMALSLLLYRFPAARRQLGGRDFMAIVQQFPFQFERMQISKVPCGDVELRIRTYLATDSDINIDHCRMMVDHVGLFSVTASRWSKAIANIMVWTCSASCPKSSFRHSNNNDTIPESFIAADLTASVGGMTLGLAKTQFFRKVIAVEIDQQRANLCEMNMKKHEMEVDVWNMDAMEAIPKLASARGGMILVLDPPWGGIDYKQQTQIHATMKLGQWQLNEIIFACSKHLTPCALGLRLPLNINLAEFSKGLMDDFNICPEIITVRKLGPQIFVVLSFVAD